MSASTKLKIAVVASALSNDARQAAAVARVMGFEGVQFEAMSPSLDLISLSQTGRREFLQVLGQNNQQLVGLRSDAGAAGLGASADLDRLLARWDKALEAAAGLRAPLLCIELGKLPDKNTEQADSLLGELGRRADRYGVIVALRSELSSFAALHRALTAAACPWFGVDLDPVSVLHDDWATNETFTRLGNLIRHVRGRDALLGMDRRTKPMPIGGGSLDWSLLLRLLDEAGFNGWITIDSMDLNDRAAGAAAGLKHLRGM
jgi:sugar phosphate isomerase/epimerase